MTQPRQLYQDTLPRNNPGLWWNHKHFTVWGRARSGGYWENWRHIVSLFWPPSPLVSRSVFCFCLLVWHTFDNLVHSPPSPDKVGTVCFRGSLTSEHSTKSCPPDFIRRGHPCLTSERWPWTCVKWSIHLSSSDRSRIIKSVEGQKVHRRSRQSGRMSLISLGQDETCGNVGDTETLYEDSMKALLRIH
jgi:hypothetical protein